METCRIVIYHPHENRRRSLKRVLARLPGFDVILVAAEVPPLLDRIRTDKPEMAIVSISNLECQPVELIDDIKNLHTDIKIICMHHDALFLDSVMKNGAAGYLLDRDLDIELFSGITIVWRGQPYISSLITDEPAS